MKNIYLITVNTFREAMARKIFITFFGLSTLFLLLMFALLISIDTNDLKEVMPQFSGPEETISHDLVKGLKLLLVVPLFGIGLLISIFSVASFIPNMLEKGNIDLLLSKPISRAQIILGKFFGGTYVVFLNVSYLIVGLWFLIGIFFGEWSLHFLITIFSITFAFAFAVLYGLIILTGVITNSSILAMMLSYLIFILISPLLEARDTLQLISSSKTVEVILDVFYYIIPKTSELGSLTSDLAGGLPISDFQPILTSALFMILTIAGSIFIFNKKDY